HSECDRDPLSLHGALPIYARSGLRAGRESTNLVLLSRGVRSPEAAGGTGIARGHAVALQRLVVLHVALHLAQRVARRGALGSASDRKSTRLKSSHVSISYA